MGIFEYPFSKVSLAPSTDFYLKYCKNAFLLSSLEMVSQKQRHIFFLGFRKGCGTALTDQLRAGVTPLPGDLTPSSGLQRDQACMSCRYTCKQSTGTHKIRNHKKRNDIRKTVLLLRPLLRTLLFP